MSLGYGCFVAHLDHKIAFSGRFFRLMNNPGQTGPTELSAGLGDTTKKGARKVYTQARLSTVVS